MQTKKKNNKIRGWAAGCCQACGKKVKKLIKVPYADDASIGSMYVCSSCAETVGTK